MAQMIEAWDRESGKKLPNLVPESWKTVFPHSLVFEDPNRHDAKPQATPDAPVRADQETPQAAANGSAKKEKH